MFRPSSPAAKMSMPMQMPTPKSAARRPSRMAAPSHRIPLMKGIKTKSRCRQTHTLTSAHAHNQTNLKRTATRHFLFFGRAISPLCAGATIHTPSHPTSNLSRYVPALLYNCLPLTTSLRREKSWGSPWIIPRSPDDGYSIHSSIRSSVSHSTPSRFPRPKRGPLFRSRRRPDPAILVSNKRAAVLHVPRPFHPHFNTHSRKQ
ncbi:hypothetical protein B0T10DRAFT_180974 [Thelonectria olida]|uniref:Uncharacterized protein n=1 Tax=Thelonectria olida TaxID=1576542 RepID=A0A9P8WDY7_9HYPO|nr:hypothetical protein B0T10DRAFT_180974 [Thelonectria olida]